MLFDVKLVQVWSNDQKSDERFLKEYRNTSFVVRRAGTLEECVRESDVIATTTPSRKPIVKSNWVMPGTHINAIGADAKGKEELEPAILKKSTLVIDDWAQASHSGEINVPVSKGLISRRDIDAELGEIVLGKKSGRKNNSEITVFDSTGLAVHDIACAHSIYEKAIKKRVGEFKRFF